MLTASSSDRGLRRLDGRETELDGEHVLVPQPIRKRLIEPDPSTFAGEDAFSFGHILIREAAYGTLPRAARRTRRP